MSIFLKAINLTAIRGKSFSPERVFVAHHRPVDIRLCSSSTSGRQQRSSRGRYPSAQFLAGRRHALGMGMGMGPETRIVESDARALALLVDQ